MDEYHINDYSDLLHRQEWEGSEGWEDETTEPIDRVLLMTEARISYDGARALLKSHRKAELKETTMECATDWHIRYLQLERVIGKAWARYLRRWADACEDGYQSQWFEPWLPQKASK